MSMLNQNAISPEDARNLLEGLGYSYKNKETSKEVVEEAVEEAVEEVVETDKPVILEFIEFEGATYGLTEDIYQDEEGAMFVRLQPTVVSEATPDAMQDDYDNASPEEKEKMQKSLTATSKRNAKMSAPNADKVPTPMDKARQRAEKGSSSK